MVNFLKVDYLKSDKCRGGVLFEYKAAFCKIRLDLTDSLTATQKLLGKTIFFSTVWKQKSANTAESLQCSYILYSYAYVSSI